MNIKPSEDGPQAGLWSTAALVAAMLVGAILIFSALTKMLSAKAFVASVEGYGVLPPDLLLPATTGVIGLEVGLGLMLILGPGRQVAARIALALLAVFVLMVSTAIRKGLADCGCFGEVIKMQPQQELILDLVLFALTAVVVWKGSRQTIGSGLLASTLGWGGFALGAAAFLAAGPVVSSSAELEVEIADLAVLAQADPPLLVADDTFLFFFAADCDHCWAYAGGVQLMHDRVEGLAVHAITSSDTMALEAFREAFHPTYPIHVLDRDAFDSLVPLYPGAVWLQAGDVAGTWAGYVPSHREIAEGGGYFYRELSAEAAASGGAETETAPGSRDLNSILGGTLGSRRH